MCHHTFVQSHGMYNSKNGACCKLWTWCDHDGRQRPLGCHKWTTLAADADDGGGCACVEAGGLCEQPLCPPLHIAVNQKLLWKYNVFKKKKQRQKLLRNKKRKGLWWELLTSEAVFREIIPVTGKRLQWLRFSMENTGKRTRGQRVREKHRVTSEEECQGPWSQTSRTTRAKHPGPQGRRGRWPHGPESTWQEVRLRFSCVRAAGERGRQYKGNSSLQLRFRNKMYFCLQKEKKDP